MQRPRAASCGASVVRVALTVLILLCGPDAARADFVGGLDPAGDNYLSLRAGPGTTFRTLRRLGPDTIVTVLDRDGVWRLVELEDGTRGWAYGKYIMPGRPARVTDALPDDEAAPVDDAAAIPEIGLWSAYTNDRYGTFIEYPGDMFDMQPPPENDDGRNFISRVGGAGFLVFASQNVFEKTIEELRDDDIAAANDNITYKRTGADWYVLSGYRGDDVFYRKTLLSENDTLVSTFEITYPKRLKTLFDPVAARMAKSFRADGAVPEEPPPPAVDNGPPSEQPQTWGTPTDASDDASSEVRLDSWHSPSE